MACGSPTGPYWVGVTTGYPLFRAICGARAAKVGPCQKSRPGQPYGHLPALAPAFPAVGVMFMAQVEPPLFRNRIRTAPVCEQCLSPRSA
jgi:hypothetical protein